MSKDIKDETREALNILGLNFDSSKEQILARTKKLRAVYEDSDTAEDIAKLAEIFKASQTLLVNFELLKYTDDNDKNQNGDLKQNFKKSITEIDVDGGNDSNSDSLKYSELLESSNSSDTPKVHLQFSSEKKKKYILFGSIGAILLIVILAISIPLGIINYKEQKELEREAALSDKYHDIESMMMNFQVSNMNTIGEYINDLPYDYRNINNIKTQYQMIMREVNIIRDGDIIRDNERMRIAYYNLVLIDNTTFTWDLSGYLSSVDNRILILNTEWRSGSMYFRFYANPSDNNRLYLGTNLPNDKQSGVDYYYTHKDNYTIFGYENQADSNDKFDAFTILSIKEDELKIYCYSNQQTYTLRP